MHSRPIVFIVGLTGVGKSSTLGALEPVRFTLLPNRRVLTDRIIIPAMQREEGLAELEVRDRLERFRLTAAWRARHRGGMVAALQIYLADQPEPARPWLFDNIRGLDEVRAALEYFAASRFIVLDAPPLVRLKRLIGRADAFDAVGKANDLPSGLQDLAGLSDVFHPSDLAQLAAHSDPERLGSAVRIILKEQQNYDAEAAASYLREALPGERYLYLDTSRASLDEVVAAVRGWL